MPDVIELNQIDDWQRLRDLEATVVLDPTAVRAAELFAGGRSKGDEETWGVIVRQLRSLATFIDCLVLYPRLPLFDYQITYERGMNEILGDLVVCGDVLLPVRVHAGASDDARVDAAKAMRAAAPVPEPTTRRIAADLQTLDWRYEWKGVQPGDDLSATHTAGDASGDPKVNSFLYVAMLYSRYAQELRGLNVIPPELSTLQLRVALEQDGAGLGETTLFNQLAEIWNETPSGVTRTLQLEQPSFLPYLLTFDDVTTPSRLFERALELREDREVRPYRKWLLEARQELGDGRLSSVRQRQLQEAANVLTRHLRARRAELPVTVSLQTEFNPTAPLKAGANFPLDLAPLRDWLSSLMPGRRYQKLLQRLVIAQRDQVVIDRQLRRVWEAA